MASLPDITLSRIAAGREKDLAFSLYLPENRSLQGIRQAKQEIPRSDKRSAFISYVREDMAVVDRMTGVFCRAEILYWRDLPDLQSGMVWKEEIRDAIRNGSLFWLASHHKARARSEAIYARRR